jgi:hypothetical protein
VSARSSEICHRPTRGRPCVHGRPRAARAAEPVLAEARSAAHRCAAPRVDVASRSSPRVLRRTEARCSRARCGSRSRSSSAAPAWTAMIETLWATTSWSSRAIRVRSSPRPHARARPTRRPPGGPVRPAGEPASPPPMRHRGTGSARRRSSGWLVLPSSRRTRALSASLRAASLPLWDAQTGPAPIESSARRAQAA